jgi:hypothetical protein
MKNFLKSLPGKVAAFVAGAALVVGFTALAQTQGQFYAGYWPQTNQNGVNGLLTFGGTVPVVSGSCGVVGPVVGGTSLGSVTTAGVTSCTLTLTAPVPTIVVSSGLNDGKNAVNSAAVPTRVSCALKDITHPAVGILYSATPTATSCSFVVATITAGDVLEYRMEGY